MKTEGDYNAYLSKNLKRFSPAVHTLKIADKFTTGISDFLIFCRGKGLGLETKFEKTFPKRESSQVLSHPFSGAQVTFLESMALTGNMGYGMVHIEETQLVYIFQHHAIPSNGNFTMAEFKSSACATFAVNDIEGLLNFFFNWQP